MPFDFSIMKNIAQIIKTGASATLTDTEFLQIEIANWKRSKRRSDMITGSKYYEGTHEILSRKRTAIGEGGTIREVENLPNNLIVDNQYAKMVDQKKNYLLGKPLTFSTEDKNYEKILKKVFGAKFQRTLKNLGEDALNSGIAWLHPYIDIDSMMKFKKFESYEILPFWADSEHTILEYAIRVYEVQGYEGKRETVIEKVEIYSKDGIERFELRKGKLVPDHERPVSSHMILIDKSGKEIGYNWERVPLIPFKYNNKETPLINRVKSLQDGINIMLSDFENNMQEDARNTILVLENYDGQNLAEFRRNLATYGVVKVKSTDGMKGGVSTLTVTVNADNYKAIVDIFKKALIENARGYDAKDEKMSGTPNQMNIQSMYNDIDLDANEMETEFQAAFEELLWFVNMYLANAGIGDFTDTELEVIFNRDMMMNESEIMSMLSSAGVEISNETLLGQVPFINDVSKELMRLKEQNKQGMDDYKNAFDIKPTEDGEANEA